MNNNKMLKDNIKAIDTATKKIKDFLSKVIDDASFVETDVFTAGKSFLDCSEALGEGVVTGYATISETPVHFFAQNQEVMKGSFSEAHAVKINKVINKAVQTGTPLISFIDCSGARVGEGVRMLEAYAEVISSLNNAKESVPHICVIKGTAVGMMASLAGMADFVIANAKDSIISTNSPQALASKEYDYPKITKILGAAAHEASSNACDFTYGSDKELKATIGDLLKVLSSEVSESTDDANRETPALDKSYTVDAALKAITDNGKFLSANAKFAPEVQTVYSLVNSIPVGIIAFDSSINDGYMSVDGVDKALNFIENASSNGLPIISLVDCLGINSTLADEVSGLSIKIAKLMSAIASCTTPMISVITGKAIGLAYTVFASKGIGFDYSLASVNAEISPITSEAAVSIAYADELKAGETRDKLAARYAEMQANPFISAKDGYIDNIIELSTMRPFIASALMMLLGV